MTREERALQIWQVLIGAARNRQTLTYEMLDDLIGMGGAFVLAHPLDVVAKHCAQHGLPPLTVLVVSKNAGEPGAGYVAVSGVGGDREQVFNYAWYRLPPRQTADLASV